MRGNSQFALVWTGNVKAEILSLDISQGGELSVDVSQVELSNGLIKDLREDIDADVELAGLAELDVLLAESLVGGLVQHDLGEDLVGEGAGHDERGVAGGTSQVDETALGKEDDVAAALHEEAVNLGLDVLDAGSVGLQPGNVNLDIEVTNVYNALV